MTRQGNRRERVELAAALRADGHSWVAIAAVLRDRYAVNSRVACREAHGWSQEEAARQWNELWPGDPKTLKNFSYWENWPAESGYAPSLVVLDRLAELYSCDVADLIVEWGRHRPATETPATGEAIDEHTLAWQVHHLDPDQLTQSVMAWSRYWLAQDRRSLLMKLGAAAVGAAVAGSARTTGQPVGRTQSADELAGVWDSRYSYFSTGRAAEFTGSHQILLRAEGDRLVGRSLPESTGLVELDLAVNGLLVTGSWTERTSLSGYYRGAVYHGTLQLVLDPTGRSMTGKWLGPDKSFAMTRVIGSSFATRSPLRSTEMFRHTER